MDTVTAVFLGIVQGLTEFLPVSSSGHLVLFQKILGVSEPPLFLDTMLHLGTLVAVLVALRQDVLRLLRHPFQRLTLLLLAATVVTVAVTLLFKDAVERSFSSGATLGWGFLATAAALLASEWIASRPGIRHGEAEASLKDAVLIGLLQGVALFPAASRSGLTIAGALSRRFNRDFAARFSFLLSLPAILGAIALQAGELMIAQRKDMSLVPILAGALAAAVVGFFTVSFMLRVIRSRTLRGFAAYLSVLGAMVLLDQHVFHIFF